MNAFSMKLHIFKLCRRWSRFRGFLIRLGFVLLLHETLIWLLCGRDVTAVLLAPNADTPVQWALVAVVLLFLRFLLLVVAPARFIWLLTKPQRKRWIQRAPD